MENKKKTVDIPSNNITLYLGASAFFISIVSAILLYREVSRMKESFVELKRLKNQLINIDSNFEDMDGQLKKLLNFVTPKENTEEQIVIDMTDDVDDESEISYEEEN